jgi:hypothetical protein
MVTTLRTSHSVVKLFAFVTVCNEWTRTRNLSRFRHELNKNRTIARGYGHFSCSPFNYVLHFHVHSAQIHEMVLSDMGERK